jgi:NDP-sugar pyrophosphorylase family protein
MKAMVLAAGLGTRLRPLTDDRPKALVTVASKTLLEITLLTLRSYGVEEVIVNVHHFADRICEYLDENGNFGMHIEISHEDAKLLDTGGGLKKAAWFFLEDGSDDPGHAALKGHDFSRPEHSSESGSPLSREGSFSPSSIDGPFILHNVDVLSTIDLSCMVRQHIEQGALATVAVQQRETSRYLLFDENGDLCGRRKGCDGTEEMVRPAAHAQALAFSGIHVISPRLLTEMREEGAFSIIDAYLNLAARGEKIAAFRADEYYWRDLGRPENIAEAERDLGSGL